MCHDHTPRRLSRVFRIVLSFALLWPWAGEAGSTRAFAAGSLAEIVQARAGRPFVLVLWSLDCPPCLKELDVLAAEVEAHPDTDLVMVSTDDPSAKPEVEARLAEHRLAGQVESWIFAEDAAQSLRYGIDPNWYGELPRSYFYDAEHRRTPLSGGLTAAHFAAWRSKRPARLPGGEG